MLDVSFVRSQYKVLTTGEYSDWAFFENAGGSYIPEQVLSGFVEFLGEYKVQPYGPSAIARRAGEAMDAGYAAIAEMINARPDEITIGPSTTLNTYVLAQGIRRTLKPGDEIIVTNQDHEANIGCWRRLAEEGAVIREWSVDPKTGLLDPADLENLLSDKTRLVCFTLCSNVVASIHDVAKLCERIHQTGALVVGDGVSLAPHHALDVQASGLDFYCFSTYKTYAPHTGVMWARGSAISQLTPQGHYFNNESPRYRMNPTGPLHAEIGALAGLRGYIDILYKHHFDQNETNLRKQTVAVFGLFAAHEEKIGNRVLDFLASRDDLRVVGEHHIDQGNRASTIAFTSSSKTSSSIATGLAQHKIACGSGNFYARRCVESMGIDAEDGVVRVSMVHYNNDEEVSRLLAALDSVL